MSEHQNADTNAQQQDKQENSYTTAEDAFSQSIDEELRRQGLL